MQISKRRYKCLSSLSVISLVVAETFSIRIIARNNEWRRRLGAPDVLAPHITVILFAGMLAFKVPTKANAVHSKIKKI